MAGTTLPSAELILELGVQDANYRIMQEEFAHR